MILEGLTGKLPFVPQTSDSEARQLHQQGRAHFRLQRAPSLELGKVPHTKWCPANS